MQYWYIAPTRNNFIISNIEHHHTWAAKYHQIPSIPIHWLKGHSIFISRYANIILYCTWRKQKEEWGNVNDEDYRRVGIMMRRIISAKDHLKYLDPIASRQKIVEKGNIGLKFLMHKHIGIYWFSIQNRCFKVCNCWE